jgi:hypothetical protein
MDMLKKHGIPLVIVAITLMWTAVVFDGMRDASPQAKAACAGHTNLFSGKNAYYWCLQRVDAGGKP